MDKTIQNIISKVYINHEDNQTIDVGVSRKMSIDLENILKGIKDICVEVSISKDAEYKKIEYGKTCAVALDIIVTMDSSKYELVIQISKLGMFAKIYWRKDTWFRAVKFMYKLPKGWSSAMVDQIRNAIEDYGIKFLEDDELSEKYEGIPNCFNSDENASVDELLFCFDGPH